MNSKDKGKRFERLVASKFREYGYDSRRTAQYCGNTGDAADVTLPYIHVECKHQEQFRIYDWMDQAKRDSKGTGKLPIVVSKKNNCEILVTMCFDDWMQLYNEYQE